MTEFIYSHHLQFSSSYIRIPAADVATMGPKIVDSKTKSCTCECNRKFKNKFTMIRHQKTACRISGIIFDSRNISYQYISITMSISCITTSDIKQYDRSENIRNSTSIRLIISYYSYVDWPSKNRVLRQNIGIDAGKDKT